MLKTLTWIGIALGAVLIIGIPLSLSAQKKITIKTVRLINASKELVYDQIRFLNNFPNWSPFKVKDPQQQHHITGEDGQEGAAFHWKGVNEKSEGKQTIARLVPNQKVLMQCDITVPFKARPTFDYTIEEKGNEVEVTQVFITELTFPANILAPLFGLKKEMTETNALGMDLLKKVSEEKAALSASAASNLPTN